MASDGGRAKSARLPSYVTAMVRRMPPNSVSVVPGSPPVVAFGDPGEAFAATLGINPSRNEFLDSQGLLLDGHRRRLATLRSLAANRLDELTDGQVARVVADCDAYFQRNPYRLWFDPLDQLLAAGLGASYYDGTACHLDLVQWATDPVWAQIGDERARRALTADGVPHLRAQLAGYRGYRRDAVQRPAGHRPGPRRRTRRPERRRDHSQRLGHMPAFAGTGAGGSVWLAWSVNLQSSWGVKGELKRNLAEWLARAYRQARSPASPPGPSAHVLVPAPADEYLPRGMRIHSKRELAAVLAAWLERSSAAATIGDVGT